jgi:hypothetical protein
MISLCWFHITQPCLEVESHWSLLSSSLLFHHIFRDVITGVLTKPSILLCNSAVAFVFDFNVHGDLANADRLHPSQREFKTIEQFLGLP